MPGRGNSRLVVRTQFGHFNGMSSSDNTGGMIITDPDAPGLSQPVTGVDESGAPVTLPVVAKSR